MHFYSSSSLAAAALTALSVLPTSVSAGYQSSTIDNIAVYWGQNSAGGSGSQGRLSEYCADSPVNIIPLAFLNGIKNPISVNFGSASDICTKMSGTNLLRCPEIEEDIQECQAMGKTILLSVGGATYNEGGFSSESEAQKYADKICAMFGPPTDDNDVQRPFGKAVIDGFDFDFEAKSSNLVPFGKRLRQNMNASPGTYYLAVAPQCPFPDVANNEMLAGKLEFDFVMVQFYNNYCGVQSFKSGSTKQNTFNFETWDNWAKSESANKNVKVMLGIPATTTAGNGYVDADTLSEIIDYCGKFSSFAGVMMWDMSQLYTNDGYLNKVADALSGAYKPKQSASTVTKTAAISATASSTYDQTSFITSTTYATTTISMTRTSGTAVATASTTESHTEAGLYVADQSGEGVSQWNQCGGSGFTGSTTCKAPFSCVCSDEWYCQCQ